MPFLSLIVPTVRVGGLDFLFDSLAKQTFTDFELILVDAHARRRADIIREQGRNRFLRVVAVEPKPNPFPVTSFCAFENAGLAAATGEVAVFVVDYSRLPPDLLAAHASFHRADTTKRAGLMMPHRYVGLDVHPDFPRYAQADINRYADDIESGRLDRFLWSIGTATNTPDKPWTVDGGGQSTADADPKLRMQPGAVNPDCFHAKNESVRLEHCRAIGGFDQDLDGGHCYQDTDFAERLSLKAGVSWKVSPAHPVEIVNPRHVFPFTKRLRSHEENYSIWQRKKAAGYPVKGQIQQVTDTTLPPSLPVAQDSTLLVSAGFQPLKIAMIYGEFASAIHGPFDLEGLYTSVGLTGSESSFFNLARGLSELGHKMVAFCVCDGPYDHPSGLTIMPIQGLQGLPQVKLDAAVAWNEPDYLRFVAPGVPRFVDQQLNDWGYCSPEWQGFVDRLVFPSESSRVHHLDDEQIELARTAGVIPNSVDLGLFDFDHPPERNQRRVVYASSPDRGLHHLLSIWPEIRQQVPDAELKIFYRLGPWLDRVRNNPDVIGKRARIIESAIATLSDGHGVTVVGLVPNVQMAREFQEAKLLAYPCDPVRYTEGFGCSVLDAAAGGCIPIISNADALPSVHGESALTVKGSPAGDLQREAWIATIVKTLRLSETPQEWKDKMRTHAMNHERMKIARAWESLIVDSLKQRSQRAA